MIRRFLLEDARQRAIEITYHPEGHFEATAMVNAEAKISAEGSTPKESLNELEFLLFKILEKISRSKKL